MGNRQEVAEAPADSDSSNDSGSDTYDSVDQSPTRNTLVFPFKLKPSPLAGATGPDWGPADYPGILRKWRDVPGRPAEMAGFRPGTSVFCLEGTVLICWL